jgi:hypothetical protein
VCICNEWIDCVRQLDVSARENREFLTWLEEAEGGGREQNFLEQVEGQRRVTRGWLALIPMDKDKREPQCAGLLNISYIVLE